MTSLVNWDDDVGTGRGDVFSEMARKILKREIPGAVSISRGSFGDDLDGVDFWVETNYGNLIGVDLKSRNTTNPAYDDLPLEMWSDVGTTIGWTRNPDKITDYVIWIWRDGRWCLVPFRQLCAVFIEHYDRWTAIYQRGRQSTERDGRVWNSECVFMPKREVWRAIYQRFANGRIDDDDNQ